MKMWEITRVFIRIQLFRGLAIVNPDRTSSVSVNPACVREQGPRSERCFVGNPGKFICCSSVNMMSISRFCLLSQEQTASRSPVQALDASRISCDRTRRSAHAQRASLVLCVMQHRFHLFSTTNLSLCSFLFHFSLEVRFQKVCLSACLFGWLAVGRVSRGSG